MSKPPKILIVDDEPMIREIWVTEMGMHDIKCDEAENGKEAAELIDNNNYDILITDLKMPKYDGYYLLSHIQRTKIKIKTYVVTGFLEEFNERIKKFDIAEIHIKPFDCREVTQKILDNYNS